MTTHTKFCVFVLSFFAIILNTIFFEQVSECLDELNRINAKICKKVEFVSIDEGILPSQCYTSLFRRVKGKPHPRGIKIWKICTKTGLCIHSRLDCFETKQKINQNYGELGQRSGIVALMVAECGARLLRSCVIGDNYFSSVRLVKHLLGIKITYIGTLRKNAKDLPNRKELEYIFEV